MENTSACSLSSSTSTGDMGESFLLLWASAVPIVALMTITVTANGIIIFMFIRTKTLQKCRNIYVMSLALADLLIGCTIPISIIETLHKQWMMNEAHCRLFLIVRYSFFFVSLLSMILISIDRWWSVNFPFSYRMKQSKKLAFGLVTAAWTSSFAVHIPPIVGWDLFADEPLQKIYHTGDYCKTPYEKSFALVLSTAIIEYFIPLLVLLILNVSIYIKLHRRRNSTKIRRSMSSSDTYMLTNRKSSSESDNNSNVTGCSDELIDLFPTYQCRNDSRRKSQFINNCKHYTFAQYINKKQTMTQLARVISNRRISVDALILASSTRPIRKSSQASSTSSKASVSSRKQSDDLVRDFLVRQDKKAFLSLGLLGIMFFVCWTPFTITEILHSLSSIHIPKRLLLICYWILASNSAINPFLYGFGNSDFRKVMRSWLYCIDYQQYKLQEALVYCQLQQTSDTDILKDFPSASPMKVRNESL